MGAGAVSAAVQGASDNSLRELMAGLNPIVRERIQIALCVLSDPVELNILLHEDLTMLGEGQTWLANCGSRLADAGHKVTFLLPADSLMKPECEAIAGVRVETYSHDRSAEDPEQYRHRFMELLRNSQVCVTPVRQMRGKYQNASFMASCIANAGLKTFLICKTGTPDPSYKAEFYGGELSTRQPSQCCTVCIADYTRKFIMENFRLDPFVLRTIYNGTDTDRFKRTPEMAEEARRRYPIDDGKFVVGSIGRYKAVKGQKVLLKAVRKLLDSGKVPNVHVLMVGEGEMKEEIIKTIDDLGLKDHVSMCEFTKETSYFYERCDVVAMPSFLEGLPDVLLEALAMETPCIASRIMGLPEVVIDGETGYCFDAGDLKDETTWDTMADGCADAIANIAALDADARAEMAANGKRLVFEWHDKAKCFQTFLDLITFKGKMAKMARLV